MLILAWLLFISLLIRFIIVSWNYLLPQQLKSHTGKINEKLSILIPARNEEDNIKNILQSIEEQDYENLEIIVLDDHSTDKTLEILQGWKSRFPFRVIRGKELPEDWLGKNYACQQLAENAAGKSILFLDADVKIRNGVIKSSIHFLRENNLTLLSVFPEQEMETAGEFAVIPIVHYLLLSVLPVSLILNSKYSFLAAANGQYMLFR